MQTATIRYQIATYAGEVSVRCHEDEDSEIIIARAKAKVRKQAGGSLPMGYQSFKVVKREAE